jgi:hypothetical protein
MNSLLTHAGTFFYVQSGCGISGPVRYTTYVVNSQKCGREIPDFQSTDYTKYSKKISRLTAFPS